MKKIREYSKRVVSVLLIAVLILCFVFSTTVEVMAATPRQEEWIAWAPGKGIDFDGKYGYQCWDVAAHYTNYIFGTVAPMGGGNAENIYANSNSAYFQKIPYDKNNPNNVPQRGDLVVWRGGGLHAGLGHVAVALSANKDRIVVLHQTNGQPTYQGNMPYYQDWDNKTRSNTCIGWLRPRVEKIIGGSGTTNPGSLESIGGVASISEITTTTARIQFDYGGRYNISHYGFFIGESQNNLTKVPEDVPANDVPYIFYYLGTGKWTAPLTPGTTYYYKYYSTINGTYRESAVYHFTTVPVAPTRATLSVTPTSAVEGKALTFKASGNNKPTKYTLTIDKGSQRVLTKEMPNGVLSINTLSTGEYSAYVTASNSAGSKQSSRVNFTVTEANPFKIAVFRAGWSDTYDVGQTIDLAARGEGGTAPYKYQFYVLRSNGSRVNFRKTPVSSNIYPWTPLTPDNYTVGVDVYDATGKKVTQEKTVRVTNNNPLYVAVFRAGNKATYRVGETVALAARGEGGVGRLRYQFYVYRSNGAKVVLRNYGYSNVFRWKPQTPDRYRVCVAIRDARGVVVTRATYVTVVR